MIPCAACKSKFDVVHVWDSAKLQAGSSETNIELRVDCPHCGVTNFQFIKVDLACSEEDEEK